MIREEFQLDDIAESLLTDVTTVIVGSEGKDSRCNSIRDMFSQTGCQTLEISYRRDIEEFTIKDLKDPFRRSKPNKRTAQGIIRNYLNGHGKSILLDLTSLQHSMILFLINILLKDMKPAHLFASYVKPQRYLTKTDDGKYELSSTVYEASGIPGMVTQNRSEEVIVPFLGFEGDRLTNIVEDMSYSALVPVIGFMTDNPSWKYEALRNCWQAIENAQADAELIKCRADSIYDAIQVMKVIEETHLNNNFVLLPLGTRPHTAACAIYAANRKNFRVLCDYAEESEQRSEGIRETIIYNLSRFII